MSNKIKTSSLEVQGAAVAVLSRNQQDFISLTDIARFKNSEGMDDLIRNWLRNRNTVEFLGVWERLNNSAFNPVKFDGIRIKAGLNRFALMSGHTPVHRTLPGKGPRAGNIGLECL